MQELGGVPVMLKSADMSNTIPDEKVVITYVSYLCARLLDIRHETRAARVIQAAWRAHSLRSHLLDRQVSSILYYSPVIYYFSYTDHHFITSPWTVIVATLDLLNVNYFQI